MGLLYSLLQGVVAIGGCYGFALGLRDLVQATRGRRADGRSGDAEGNDAQSARAR